METSLALKEFEHSFQFGSIFVNDGPAIELVSEDCFRKFIIYDRESRIGVK